jgi:3-(3-hydroxy-phenyl)propionate hydroxylase
VNSGRLSVPAVLHDSALNTPDTDEFQGRVSLGCSALDAPVLLPDGNTSWLLKQLSEGFTLMVFDDKFEMVGISYPCEVLHIQPAVSDGKARSSNALVDCDGLIVKRYDMQPGTAHLIRPDQHVCARWRVVSAEKVNWAIDRVLAKTK